MVLSTPMILSTPQKEGEREERLRYSVFGSQDVERECSAIFGVRKKEPSFGKE